MNGNDAGTKAPSSTLKLVTAGHWQGELTSSRCIRSYFAVYETRVAGNRGKLCWKLCFLVLLRTRDRWALVGSSGYQQALEVTVLYYTRGAGGR